MNSIVNAAPRINHLGGKDESRVALVIENELIPTHLPHLYTFAEWGDTLPQVVIGDTAVRAFGAKTFDLRSPYATHQTLMYQAITGAGNQVMLQRVIPTDAPPPASLVLFADYLEEQVPVYNRNLDGSLVLDVNGQPIPTLNAGTPVMVPGATIKWVVKKLPQVNAAGVTISQAMITAFNGGDTSVDIVPVANLMGSLTPGVGDRTNSVTSTASILYPIRELETNFQGERGNRYGVRFAPLHAKSLNPYDTAVVEENEAFPYMMQILYKETAKSTPFVVETLNAEQFIPFMDKEGALNSKTDTELFFDLRAIPDWQDLEQKGVAPTYGPFGRIHTYYNYIQEVSAKLAVLEAAQNANVSADPAKALMINFMTAQDIEGNMYRAIRVLGPTNGGVLMNEYATHYPSGGADGTMTFDTFDELVATQVSNYGDLEAKVMDMARYPVSCIWDSGFTLETKKKLLVPMGRRKDILTILSTQSLNYRQNTVSEETSITTALRAAARLYPESEVYGTSVMRAAIVGHSGNLLQSQWRGIAPLTVELAGKVAKYMGAGTGIWEDSQSFDVHPGNLVTQFRNVNCTWKPNTTKTKDWANGLIWVQYFDRDDLMFPGMQTVYDDDNSVFNSLIVAFIVADLEKVAFRVWAKLTNDSKLTPEQFLEKSDRLILDEVKNKYDGRVIIRPRTYYTSADAARGYSWSTDIVMEANVNKTVGTVTVIGRRIAATSAT